MNKKYETPIAKKISFDFHKVLASSAGRVCSGVSYTYAIPYDCNLARVNVLPASLASEDPCIYHTNIN